MSKPTSNDVPTVYNVSAFCRAHGISRAHFYNLQKQGKGPRIMKLGRRTLITVRAAKEWRDAMEQRSTR